MLLIMGAGFRGYVLVGSQMRYWAAMVITSLIGVIPVKGEELLY
jgi:quinol-cytochrome oxidoreductase complex cytochrome b subunit